MAGAAGPLPSNVDGFLTLPDALGTSRSSGHINAFVVTDIGFAVANSASFASGGGGAGTGKPSWSPLSVTVDAGGAPGLPTIYSDASSGTVLPTVTLEVDRRSATAGLSPLLVVTLTNAVIQSTATTVGTGASLALTFAFSKIDISFGTQNQDGSAGTAVDFSFDLLADTSGGSPVLRTSVTYALNVAVPGDEFATAFSPPTQMASGSSLSGGAGAGKTSFSTPSLTLPTFDASVLNSIGLVATGSTLPKVDVSLFKSTGGAAPFAYLTYDFAPVLETSVSVSGLTPTLSFAFAKILWTSTAQNPDGSAGTPVTTGWDLTTNSSIP